MENMIADKVKEGQNIVSYLESDGPPYENSDGANGMTQFVKWSPSWRLLILSENSAFAGLKSLSLRDYYLQYRTKINFIRMNQAILFETVDTNISDFFNFSNSGIHNFSPSRNATLHQLENHKYKSIILHEMPGIIQYDPRKSRTRCQKASD
jgi:hypothetical protein